MRGPHFLLQGGASKAPALTMGLLAVKCERPPLARARMHPIPRFSIFSAPHAIGICMQHDHRSWNLVVWRRRRRISIRAADLVGAEVARAAWSRVVARDARMDNCYQQQTLVRSLHGFLRRATAAVQRTWTTGLDARVLGRVTL